MIRFDLTGDVYGRLTVIGHVGKSKYGISMWNCRCECGNEYVGNSNSMRTGKTLSCGCLQSQRAAEANAKRATHGLARRKKGERPKFSPTYQSWKCMVERCVNPNAPNAHLYGGRGITVCDRWQGRDGFTNFLADLGERPEGKTIDRINTDGNYEPGNVKWSTPKEQAANRRPRKKYS